MLSDKVKFYFIFATRFILLKLKHFYWKNRNYLSAFIIY